MCRTSCCTRGWEWCRWSDSNRHDFLRSQDFKSCASAISPHRHPRNAAFQTAVSQVCHLRPLPSAGHNLTGFWVGLLQICLGKPSSFQQNNAAPYTTSYPNCKPPTSSASASPILPCTTRRLPNSLTNNSTIVLTMSTRALAHFPT